MNDRIPCTCRDDAVRRYCVRTPVGASGFFLVAQVADVEQRGQDEKERRVVHGQLTSDGDHDRAHPPHQVAKSVAVTNQYGIFLPPVKKSSLLFILRETIYPIITIPIK